MHARITTLEESPTQSTLDIAQDLTWVDMLKGIAIIGVFFDNWLNYFLYHGLLATTQTLVDLLATILRIAVGPFVQVFFILSGFGLTWAFLNTVAGWSWKRWTWRRITKIIFPYYVFVILSFVLGMIGSLLYESIDLQLSWTSLIAHLTFTRNFYPPSWGWNPPLWYMPVIIGLYIIFPPLIWMLNKWGPVKLLLISIIISYSTLIIAFAVGATGNHSSDLFLFWTVQFVMGMLLAYIRFNKPEKLRLLLGYRAFIIGTAFFFCSWIMRTYIPYGKVFNDSITSLGIFLILLNMGWGFRKIFPLVDKILNSLSRQSYFMYLVHYPVMKFLLGPMITNAMHPVIVIILGGIYIVLIFYLCSIISKPVTALFSKLYARYDATKE